MFYVQDVAGLVEHELDETHRGYFTCEPTGAAIYGVYVATAVLQGG